MKRKSSLLTVCALSRQQSSLTFGLARRLTTEKTNTTPPPSLEHQVVIVGGGTAGLSVGWQLTKHGVDVAIVEPSTSHFYQPGWTMVGAGVFDALSTVRPESKLIPPKAKWIQEAVTSFAPETDTITTNTGRQIKYKALVVCAGFQLNWDAVKGLPETLGKNNVTSNYSFKHAPYTWELVQRFKGGEAIFTQPSTPIKCGGGPQKAMYLSDDYWSKHNITNRHVTFITGTPSIFAAKHYAERLNKICDERKLDRIYKHNLIEVRGASQEAVFLNLDTKEEVVKKFDFLHVVPPMSAPDFIRQSPLVNAAGFVDVDKATTRHVKYPKIFSLGDCSSLPTSKTAAAVSAQAPVTVSNLLSSFGRGTAGTYSGYTSCPIPTEYGKLMLCEFDYTMEPCETFFFDQSVPRSSMYMLKKFVIPRLYWSGLVKGTWHGPSRPWPKGRFSKKQQQQK